MSIQELLGAYRRLFPMESITPKLHLLEDHATTQLGQLGVGFSLMNEQGGELIHSEFNRIGRVMHGMKGDFTMLMATMKRHHIGTAPPSDNPVTKQEQQILQYVHVY